MTRFSYYVIRVRSCADGTPEVIAGVVERLSSGEKRSFVTGADLVSVIATWSSESNMGSE